MHRPSDWDVNWMSPVQGKSPPVQVKEPYGSLDLVCYLSIILASLILEHYAREC